MLGKKKDSAASVPAVEEDIKGQKKGRPTPTRKQAEAQRVRPLIPADRKAAKKAAQAKRNEDFRREQEALRTGDERYMPAAHRGLVRRFIRDSVDARWSVSEFLLPVMLLFMVGLTSVVFFFGENPEISRWIVSVLSAVFYGLFIISIIEGFFVWRSIKRSLALTYPNENLPRGAWFYMYSRLVMARRWRTPAAQVGRGEYPGKKH